jgi:S1-C subfamily serine protease
MRVTDTLQARCDLLVSAMFFGLNRDMLLAPLLCFLGAAFNPPGQSVDVAADDRALFTQAETATANLAEGNKSPLNKETRLAQVKRTSTTSVRLQAPIRDKQLNGEEAYRVAAAASVLITGAYKCDKCTRWHCTLASGVVVDPDGVIATNHHVAAGEQAVAMGVMTADGRFFPVTEVLAANKGTDVALLRVDAKGLTALPVRDDLGAGAAIYCYSHPANSFGCFTDGIVTRYCRLGGADRNGAVFMQITADYARGSSGGPIIDQAGNLVGLVSSTSPVLYTDNAAAKGTPTGQGNLQMVRHNCVTGRAILDLTRPPTNPAGAK